MNLDDKSAVKCAAAYDELIRFVSVLETLPDTGLRWMEFQITTQMLNSVSSSVYDFLHAARVLVRQEIEE